MGEFYGVEFVTSSGVFHELEYLRRLWSEMEFALMAPTRAVVLALNVHAIQKLEGCCFCPSPTERKPLASGVENAKLVDYYPWFLAPGCRVLLVASFRKEHKLLNCAQGRCLEINQTHVTVKFGSGQVVKFGKIH